MSTEKLVTGVLIGAAVGAVLGVLFAPQKGSETRRIISEKGGDLTDVVREKFNELGEALSDKYESLKNSAKGMVQTGKEKLTQAKEEVKGSLA